MRLVPVSMIVGHELKLLRSGTCQKSTAASEVLPRRLQLRQAHAPSRHNYGRISDALLLIAVWCLSNREPDKGLASANRTCRGGYSCSAFAGKFCVQVGNVTISHVHDNQLTQVELRSMIMEHRQ